MLFREEGDIPMSGSILVSGASGHLGRRVLENLLVRVAPSAIVATTRKPESLAEFAARGVQVRRADFDDASTLGAAFAGVERALLISTDSLDEPGHRVEQHRRAIGALARAGARYVAYTSIVNPIGSLITLSKDHAQTEQALAESGLHYTVLRNNMYSDYTLDPAKRALAGGSVVNARGSGRVGFVTRADCAAIAAAVLVEPPTGNQTLDVTGPEALDSADFAALLSQLSGRPVAVQSIPVPALVEGMVQHGVPRHFAEILGSFDAGIAAGELAVVSDSVERFTGKKPESLADFLLRERSAWS
jgi:NAD(P)H dehydrogenase (quinone)